MSPVLGGYGEWGCAAEMGDFFQKKSLNMPPTFAEKIPKHAPHFCNFTVDTRYFRPFRR